MNIVIDKILKENGKTRFWLSKETGIAYPNIMKLCNNETTSIKFENIERICDALNCTPNDFLR